MNIEELKERLDANGLGEYYDIFQPYLRPAIRLHQKKADENKIAAGQTKIGGRPDLPKEITWPTETGAAEAGEKKSLFSSKKEGIAKPLSFIAQINLSETSRYDAENLLPKSGLLYFFYSAEQEAWGFDPKDKNKFKVLYWDGNFDELIRVEFPLDLPDDSCYKACSVDIESEINLPSVQSEIYEDFTEEEDDKFWIYVYNESNVNKLLGYSDTIQDDMELECELVTNGYYLGTPSRETDEAMERLEPNAKDWLLLLQIDSNEENDMMWGDSGRLYFWIKKDDLLNKNFDKSWFCLQCY